MRMTTARRAAAPPITIPIIAPNDIFEADDDEDDFVASATAVEALLLVLLPADDVVVDDEPVKDRLVEGVVESVVDGAELVTRFVGGCYRIMSEKSLENRILKAYSRFSRS